MASETPPNRKHKAVRSYMKYSGIAYQMIGLVALCIFLGLKADAYFGNEQKLITAGLTLFVIVAYLYKLTRTLL